MSPRRFFGIFSGIVGAVLLALVLYIAFGDLSRHKGRIEAFVTQSLGRPFAIDGPFKLKVLPVIDVSAERVRLGNAQGGSQPQMLEIGKVATQIGLWSLISGPPDVRSFELRDMTVLLELAPDGKSNWIMGTPTADDEAEEEADEGAVEVPVVIRSAQLSNVRLIYREASKADRALQLDTLSITPGREELLAMDGQGKLEGKLDTFPLSLKGEMGPLKSLLSARDMRMAMQVSLGKLALDVNGVIGRLDPLDGADLTLKVEQPELGAVLEALDLPVIATGPIRIDTRLKDAGALTQLDFNTKVGDLEASVNGTLKTLSLVGSDLKFEATAADAARLASVFEVSGVPAAPLTITGHTVHSGKEITFEALTAAIADASVRVNGSMRLTRDRRTALRFELAAPSLARLRETWPELKVSASGAFESAKDRIEVKDLQAALGENQLAGSLLLTGRRETYRGAAVIAAYRPHALLPAGEASRHNRRRDCTAASKARAARNRAAEEVHVQRDAAVSRQDKRYGCEGAPGLWRTGARRAIHQGPRQQPASGSRADNVRHACSRCARGHAAGCGYPDRCRRWDGQARDEGRHQQVADKSGERRHRTC